MEEKIGPAQGPGAGRLNLCPRCVARGKQWSGSDPRCAFLSGVFDPDNWMCATMNGLRDLVDGKAIWNEDQHGAILPAGNCGEFLVLSWYKSRGCTEGAWIAAGSQILPLTHAAADSILESYKDWDGGRLVLPTLRIDEPKAKGSTP